MPENITAARRETFTPGTSTSKPKLRITWNDGRYRDLEGNEALANYGGPEGVRYQTEYAADAARNRLTGPTDPRGTTAHNFGLALHNIIKDPNSYYHRYMSNGPVAGAIPGAAVGLLGGLLANWISDAASERAGFAPRRIDHRWLGAALGAALGGYAGHKHLEKKSAMFVDPRNAILEKLQSANDVTTSDKVKLAAAIRRMDYASANRLATKLRSVLGFGVGAIIARALGMSLGGALFGGIVGLMGSGLLSSINNAQKNNARLFL